LQLLDALDWLEAADRRFQIRSRISQENGNGRRGRREVQVRNMDPALMPHLLDLEADCLPVPN
jgi:hypothetical protein